MKSDLLSIALDRMQLCADSDRDNREEALDDLKNLTADQWPEEIRRQREKDGRPCLTINQLPQFLRQVTGDLRQMNPAVNVSPADGEAKKETAEIYEGLFRDIHYRSDGSSVFERAAESAAACGMGYFRILTEYEDETSFNQVIRIASIMNPFSVYFDPQAVLPTREDAQYCFVTEAMDVEAFEKAYPGKKSGDFKHDGQTDQLIHWSQGKKIIVAEYFWKEMKPAKLVMLEDGRTVVDPKGPVRSINERKTQIPVIKWAKLSAGDVLEGPTEYPGRHIPVIAVMGEELYTDKRVYRSSVIRYAKDPQRLYNYWWSAQTEVVALQPKQPWVMTKKQEAGYEQQWSNANNSNTARLLYNPDPNAPPPQRQMPAVTSSGMMDMLMLAGNDLRATTGIQNAALGLASDEKSGVAIRQRQMESDVSTSIYADNMGKAIEHCGRVIVDMIPKVYDTERLVRLVGKDDTQSMVRVNMAARTLDAGDVVINDLAQGRYDVRVSVGPNYSTKRQETAQSMMEFVQALPQAGAVASDLIAKSMDWPGADELAERLKKTLPPGIVPPDENEPPDPMQQQQMAQQAEMQRREGEMIKITQETATRKADAEAAEAEARAKEADFKAQKAEFELQLAMRTAMTPPQPQATA